MKLKCSINVEWCFVIWAYYCVVTTRSKYKANTVV